MTGTHRLIEDDDRIGDRPTLAEVPLRTFTDLRTLLTGAARIRTRCQFLVCVDGLVIGGFGVKPDTITNPGALPGPVVELIGFASPALPRLERLVLAAAVSVEARGLVERTLGRRIRSMVTTVPSDDEASTEHRAVLHLIERRPAKRGSTNRFNLVYGRQVGQWTMTEALDEWKATNARVDA